MDYCLLVVSSVIWLWISFGKHLSWKYQIIFCTVVLGYVGYRCRLGRWLEFVSQLETVTAGLPIPNTIRTAIRLTRNLSTTASRSSAEKQQLIPHTHITKPRRSVTALQKRYVAAQQRWKCRHCRTLLDETYEVDHIQPLFQGGSNEIPNLQALCRQCHGKKTIQEQL